MSGNVINIHRITEVNDGVIEATKRLVPALDSGNQATISAEYLQQIVDSPNTYWLGAQLNDDPRIIGMAILNIMPMITNVRATLECVVVDESARGKIVGSALCYGALVIADSHRVNTLRAAASKDNVASLGMLEGLDFEIETSMHYLERDIKQGNRFDLAP